MGVRKSKQPSAVRRAAAAAALLVYATTAEAQTRPAASPAGSSAAAAVARTDVARFRTRAEAALAEARAEKGYWGALVVDESTGETLFALNSDRYFAPASNTKLFTTALAMASLGPDYRFRTTIETHGVLDSYGRLRGDLVLVGRGDPNLSNRKFPFAGKVEREGPLEKVLGELADGVVARGVRQIEGDIVADDSYFSPERYPPGWAIDDMSEDYGAAVSALAVNDNTLEIEVRPGARNGEPAWFGVEPWADFYSFENQIATGTPDATPKLEARREPGSRQVELRGVIRLGSEPQKIYLGIDQPAEFAAALLKRLLEARGVRNYGTARARHLAGPDVSAPLLMAEHVSPPLVEAVGLLNKISQNLHAELLLRAVARERAGTGSREAGLKLEQEFLTSAGIAENDIFLVDGSGLSRRNLVTPEAVVKLLRFAARQNWAEAFAATLPVAGEDGTLQDRMKSTAAAGHIRAKTGSLEHVRSISGYATTARGARLVFSMFGNNNTLHGKDAASVLDALCVAMVEELGPAGDEKGKHEPPGASGARK